MVMSSEGDNQHTHDGRDAVMVEGTTPPPQGDDQKVDIDAHSLASSLPMPSSDPCISELSLSDDGDVGRLLHPPFPSRSISDSGPSRQFPPPTSFHSDSPLSSLPVARNSGRQASMGTATTGVSKLPAEMQAKIQAVQSHSIHLISVSRF